MESTYKTEDYGNNWESRVKLYNQTVRDDTTTEFAIRGGGKL
jgi:hypothetical protein